MNNEIRSKLVLMQFEIDSKNLITWNISGHNRNRLPSELEWPSFGESSHVGQHRILWRTFSRNRSIRKQTIEIEDTHSISPSGRAKGGKLNTLIPWTFQPSLLSIAFFIIAIKMIGLTKWERRAKLARRMGSLTDERNSSVVDNTS